jgi:hypothetical protein
VPETVCVTYITLFEWLLLKEIKIAVQQKIFLQGISSEEGELAEKCTS